MRILTGEASASAARPPSRGYARPSRAKASCNEARMSSTLVMIATTSQNSKKEAQTSQANNSTTTTVETLKDGNGHRLCRVLNRREDQACAKACAKAYLSDD